MKQPGRQPFLISIAFATVLFALLASAACRADDAAPVPVQVEEATVSVDGIRCPSPSSGVRIVRGDADVCPTSVNQVLSEQDPADVPLSLALMGGAMLGLLFMRGRRR